MWDCLLCGCKAIVRDLGFCPHCFKPKEASMPKATTGGASNAKAEPGEPGYIAPEGAQEAAQVLTGAGMDPADVAAVTGTAEPEGTEAPGEAAAAPAAPEGPAATPKRKRAAAASSAPDSGSETEGS